jgi:hypothetical protein
MISLSGRILLNCVDVNTFDFSTENKFTEGDVGYIYFQLIDQNKDQSLRPAGRRYTPAASATLTVTITNPDSSKIISRSAAQPFVGDNSIWRVAINATDALAGTYSLQLALVEGAVTTRGIMKSVLSVTPQTAAFI